MASKVDFLNFSSNLNVSQYCCDNYDVIVVESLVLRTILINIFRLKVSLWVILKIFLTQVVITPIVVICTIINKDFFFD